MRLREKTEWKHCTLGNKMQTSRIMCIVNLYPYLQLQAGIVERECFANPTVYVCCVCVGVQRYCLALIIYLNLDMSLRSASLPFMHLIDFLFIGHQPTFQDVG